MVTSIGVVAGAGAARAGTWTEVVDPFPGLSPDSVHVLTVKLSGTVPGPTSYSVAVSSDNPNVINVPSHVIVPPGADQATFTVTFALGVSASGLITASLPGSTQSGPYGFDD